ncbi:methylosome protein 50-like [Chelonus insularis]|uniref:methylosome protein 50-like n=1 Tax=Chelonus insularis TaxID=460826 RepID=UPI00158F5EC4|nr:methylosome protein 50-like [Chelonus insularis]
MSNNEYFPHPNSNVDVYRNMSAADRSPVPDKHLQFITVYNDEKAILGASNMIDRYWSGTVWFFNGCSNFDRKNATIAMRTESGVCDADFLDKDRFVVTEDSGVIQILEVVQAADTMMPEIRYLKYECQHDDGITSLAIFDNKTHFVTSGLDYCIKVWHAAELLAENSFSSCHTGIITSVDVMPKSDSVFASTSLDCDALIWDIKQSTPATHLHKKNDNGLTAISWNPSDSHYVAIGAEDGSITLIDLRSPTAVLFQSTVFSRPVHKLKYHAKRKNLLAACSDDTVVKVIDTSENLDIIYENNQHSDFVRGFAWLKDELITCSWDNSVLKHTLSKLSK